YRPLLTGTFSPLAEPWFLVSDRYALKLNSSVPLSLRHFSNISGSSKKPIFCIMSKTLQKSTSRKEPQPLNYDFGFDFIFEYCNGTICSGQSLRSFYETVFRAQLPKPTKLPNLGLFTEPIWTFWSPRPDGMRQENILDYA